MIFRKSKLFMGGTRTLTFEKQDWGFVRFLVCIAVFYFHFFFGVLGSFLGLCVPRLGRICIRTPISVCYIILLEFAYFDWFAFVLLFYNSGCVLTLHLNQRSGYSKVIILVLYLIQMNKFILRHSLLLCSGWFYTIHVSCHFPGTRFHFCVSTLVVGPARYNTQTEFAV
jgi:hypothetical protein